VIAAGAWVGAAAAAGFRFYCGVPCSYLKPFINYVIDAPELRYVGAANEGDAVALAMGATLAGQRAVVMFQNSGFGNAVNPLTSLSAIFRVPALLICTWRGEPGGAHDEPQHDLMGEITPGLFDLLKIPWELFPDREDAIAGVLARATRHMDETGLPYGLLMKKDTVSPHELKAPKAPTLPTRPGLEPCEWPGDRPTRRQALAAVRAAAGPDAALVATTGFTGRSLYALGDLASQLYVIGGMGCASSLGLGLALARPDRRVVVLDGDGAALMRLGALATVGFERPANLVHVLLDNEAHESTGAQATVSHAIDLGAVAQACGYPRVVRAPSIAALSAAIEGASAGAGELTFVHVKIATGEEGPLPRPSVTPPEVAARFKAWLAAPAGAAP
jgi:phosphonopyruvate decarboxylase